MKKRLNDFSIRDHSGSQLRDSLDRIKVSLLLSGHLMMIEVLCVFVTLVEMSSVCRFFILFLIS